MNFYVTLVFLGIILVSLSLVWVILDKKKAFGFARSFEDKKQELVEIINDAEQMIEELNRFSDYIVTQMDLKNEELRMNLKNADEDIKNLVQKAQSVKMSIAAGSVKEEAKLEYKTAAVVNGSVPEMPPLPVDMAVKQNSVPAAESTDNGNTAHTPVYQQPRQIQRKSEKVIPINNRYGEVLHLAKSGLSELEIARTLNMGKGEVELILGINKNLRGARYG